MGQRLGSTIGATGGVTFVLVNAGSLSDIASVVLRIVGIASFGLVVWYAVIRTRNWPAGPLPSAPAMRMYWACVAAEVLAIVLGAQVLIRVLGEPDLILDWVVLVVGLHFLPFAQAFRLPIFTVLGALLIAVALVGGLVTITVSPTGSTWAGVTAGFLLLTFAALGPVQRKDWN